MFALSVQRVGAFGALLVACCLASFALFVLFTPVAVLSSAGTAWTLLAADYALLLAGLFGLAVVPAVAERVAPLAPGWMRWTGTLAQLGFAVLAVVSAWQIDYETALTDAALTGFPPDAGAGRLDVAAETAAGMRWVELLSRAPRGWLDAAAIGLWMFSASVLGRDHFPEDLNSVGRVAGALAFCAPLGVALGFEPLLILGVLGILLMQPLWFAWIGLVLLRAGVTRPVHLFVMGPRLARRTKQVAAFLHLDRAPARRSGGAEQPIDPACSK